MTNQGICSRPHPPVRLLRAELFRLRTGGIVRSRAFIPTLIRSGLSAGLLLSQLISRSRAKLVNEVQIASKSMQLKAITILAAIGVGLTPLFAADALSSPQKGEKFVSACRRQLIPTSARHKELLAKDMRSRIIAQEKFVSVVDSMRQYPDSAVVVSTPKAIAAYESAVLEIKCARLILDYLDD